MNIIQTCIDSSSMVQQCKEWEYTFGEGIILIFYFSIGFFIFFKVLSFVYDFIKK